MGPPLDPRCIEQDAQAGQVEIWTTIANSYIQPLLSAFGIVGNVFMLLTIYYGHLSDSPYVYLQCIALGDLILLIVICGLSVARCATCQFSLETAYYLKLYDRYIYLVLSNLMIGWLVLLTLFMTIERFVYVRWPMKTQSWCTRERAKKVCLVLFVVACTSQPLRMFEERVVITSLLMPKIGTDIRTASDFTCKYGTKENSTLRCFNDEFPLEYQIDLAGTPCPTSPSLSPPSSTTASEFRRLAAAGLPEVPLSNGSLVSLQCLHAFCRMPVIPPRARWIAQPDLNGAKAAKLDQSDDDNVTLIALDVGKDQQLFGDEFIGKAFLINGTCTFLIAQAGGNHTPHSMFEAFTEPYTAPVQCVKSLNGSDQSWKGRWRRAWLLLWDRINIACTAVLITFNVMIVFVVHRANRKAHERVLSTNKQGTASRRRQEENRLTMSLMALCCVKIISEVTYITSDEEFAWLFYKEINPPGFRLKFHQIVSNVVVIFEYSSYFYLLAFINRKFKREFLKQVVYGKFLRQRFFGATFRNLSRSSHGGSIASNKDPCAPAAAAAGSATSSAVPSSPASKVERKPDSDLEKAIQEFGDKAL